MTVNFYDITANNTSITGAPDDDKFRIHLGGLSGLSLFGNPGGVNTINFLAAGTLTFDAISAITNFKFSASGPLGQFIYLTAANLQELPGGSTPTFHVTGPTANHAAELVIEPSGQAQNLNFRHVAVSNFARADDAFVFDFGSDTTNDRVVGALHARNLIEFGSGNDTGIGGTANDVFSAGQGNDYFNGGGGINVVDLDGNLNHFGIVKIAPNEYRVHDHSAGPSHGHDTLVNIQYIRLNDATIYIGGNVPVVTVGSSAALAHGIGAHHVDLIA